MHRAPRLLLAFLLGTGVVTVHPAVRLMASSSAPSGKRATLKPAAVTAPDIPFIEPEVQVEQDLLQLANQSRAEAGAPGLTLDTGLSQAARIHAQAMLQARQLSHRFPGEASLAERLADMTNLQLDQAGENVALDYDARVGHEHLMLSPPHRANLLNPAYNVVGLGVARSGDRLYIVQDFGHALPSFTSNEVKQQVSAAVSQMRQTSKLHNLLRHDLAEADQAACSMAQADKLGTSPVQVLAKRFTVLSYTSLHPESLPSGTSHAITSHNLHSLSVGACYGRTQNYPTGVYWIVLSLD